MSLVDWNQIERLSGAGKVKYMDETTPQYKLRKSQAKKSLGGGGTELVDKMSDRIFKRSGKLTQRQRKGK